MLTSSTCSTSPGLSVQACSLAQAGAFGWTQWRCRLNTHLRSGGSLAWSPLWYEREALSLRALLLRCASPPGPGVDNDVGCAAERPAARLRHGRPPITEAALVCVLTRLLLVAHPPAGCWCLTSSLSAGSAGCVCLVGCLPSRKAAELGAQAIAGLIVYFRDHDLYTGACGVIQCVCILLSALV